VRAAGGWRVLEVSRSSRTTSRRTRLAASYAFLVLVGATMLFPFLWMIKTSLQSPAADVTNLRQLLPERLHPENYRTVVQELGFRRSLMNSAVVTVLTTAALVFTSSLAAFAFARLEFFGRDQLFLGYLSTMMVPASVTMIPVFLLLRELRWIDTYAALIIPPAFSAYGVFMLRQFFLGIPRELEEAAIIDGCSKFGVYWRIILPLAKPALAALTVLTFIGSWRSFMWPLIVTQSREKFTLPVALTSFQEMYGVQWTLLMAGSVIMIAPMIVVFLLGQRFFIEGIQLGAVKG
jgi:multiple sugar transport system permease protein